jgi:hypothetical protein
MAKFIIRLKFNDSHCVVSRRLPDGSVIKPVERMNGGLHNHSLTKSICKKVLQPLKW